MPLSEARRRQAGSATLDDVLTDSTLCNDFYTFLKGAQREEFLEFLFFVGQLGGNEGRARPIGIRPPGAPNLGVGYTPAARGKSKFLWVIQQFVDPDTAGSRWLSLRTQRELMELKENTDNVGRGANLTAASFTPGYVEIYGRLLEPFGRWQLDHSTQLAQIEVARERRHQRTKLTKHRQGLFRLYENAADNSGPLVFVSSSMSKVINRESEARVVPANAQPTKTGFWVRTDQGYTVAPRDAAQLFRRALQECGLQQRSVDGATVAEVQGMAPNKVKAALARQEKQHSDDIDARLAGEARQKEINERTRRNIRAPGTRTVNIAGHTKAGHGTVGEALKVGRVWFERVLGGRENRVLVKAIIDKLRRIERGGVSAASQAFGRMEERIPATENSSPSWYLVAYADITSRNRMITELSVWLYRGATKPAGRPPDSNNNNWYRVWSEKETLDSVRKDALGQLELELE